MALCGVGYPRSMVRFIEEFITTGLYTQLLHVQRTSDIRQYKFIWNRKIREEKNIRFHENERLEHNDNGSKKQ